ncbi:MAG: TIGR03087 family PEP-CTERM/XrtA system glycosyltransferase [Chloroflexi bacterium]|nr:TIGR03087 family PEP-CTERM/XrtA system glycosyltransferase [Chloroflexota bacterium]
MRILFLTSRLPYPPNRGDRSRVFNFIKHLSCAHELSLASFIAHESEQDHVASLQPFCHDVRIVMTSPLRSVVGGLCNLWRPDPLQSLYYRSGAMHRLVDQLLAENQFDTIYVHLFRMAPYVLHRPDLYRIVDLTDVISQELARSMPYRGLVSRLAYGMEMLRIQRYERHVAENFEETWLVSEAGKRVLSKTCSAKNIQVVPIGVNENRLYPTGQPYESNSLIFVGHLRVFHNVDAVIHLVQDVLPLIRQQIPDCTLKIVGADPDPRVRRLANDPAVTVTGFVPDLNNYLNRAAVFAAPLRFAAGVQTKVLEAMATARPVVTTSVVNAGLGAKAGHELLVADDAETTAKQIVALLQDAQLGTRIGQAGLHFVHQKYNWNCVVQRMNAIEEHLAAEQK